jgi:hypothetical protein
VSRCAFGINGEKTQSNGERPPRASLSNGEAQAAGQFPTIGREGALRGDRFRLGRRSVHAAHLCGRRPERAGLDQRAHQGRAQGPGVVRPVAAQETEREIYEAYASGASRVGLAKTYGVSRQTIYGAINRYKAVRLTA